MLESRQLAPPSAYHYPGTPTGVLRFVVVGTLDPIFQPSLGYVACIGEMGYVCGPEFADGLDAGFSQSLAIGRADPREGIDGFIGGGPRFRFRRRLVIVDRFFDGPFALG